MQPSLLFWLVSSALGSAKSGGGDQQRYFEVVFQPKPRRWPYFFASLLGHLVVLVALPSLLEALAPAKKPELWIQQFRRLDQELRIRVPERLYLASGGQRQVAPRRRAGSPGANQRAREAARARTPAAGKPAPRVKRPRRRFELPPSFRRVEHPQSILQAELPAELPLERNLRLPEMFFWAPRPPTVIRPKVFVVPGYARAPEALAQLDAPPRLELPPEQPSLPVLQLPIPTETAEEALGFAPPSGLPLRTSTPAEPAPAARSGTVDAAPGNPVTVLSLSTDPRPLREVLVIPPASQVGAQPPTSGGAGGARAEPASAAKGTAARGEASGEAVVALNPPDVAAPLPELARLRPALVGETTPGAPAAPAPPRPAPLAEDTRVVHPTSGVFDVVVQSSGTDGFPESAGVLTGKPIYSVYVNVGATKEWILQYCIPAGEAQEAEVVGGVVRLGSPSPLVAPYPRVTFRPPLKKRQGSSYVMIHGFLDVNGRLEGLKVLGVNVAEDSAAVTTVLQQWEFRPATQDGRPVRVEVLLAIPPE
jgi:hypothetical protein